MWIKGLLFHELIHFFSTAIIAGFLYWKFGDLKLIVIAFAVAFMIDLDHLFDYWYFAGNLNFRSYLSGIDYFAGSQKVFVFLHSWELAGFLGIWAWIKKRPTALAISLAILGHLLVDQLSYTSNPLAYFLIFRAVNNFSLVWFNGL